MRICANGGFGISLECLRQESVDSSTNIIIVMPCDLSELSSAQNIFQSCKQMSVDVKILINNAGCGMFGDHASADQIFWSRNEIYLP